MQKMERTLRRELVLAVQAVARRSKVWPDLPAPSSKLGLLMHCSRIYLDLLHHYSGPCMVPQGLALLSLDIQQLLVAMRGLRVRRVRRERSFVELHGLALGSLNFGGPAVLHS